MANNFDSNFTRMLAQLFLTAFNTERVLSKNVNTQLLKGKFNPSTGDTVDFKRPTDYKSVRTPTGDVSGETESPIITGKASGVVQDYFTAFVSYSEAEEAIKMAQKGEPGQANTLLGPMATRIVTDLELDYAAFMLKNAALSSGTYGTGVSSWDHIAAFGSTMSSHGIPRDKQWCAAVNPYTQTKLASVQRSLGAGGAAGSDIKTAHERAVITSNFGGMQVMEATTLASYTSHSGALRAGVLSANPDVTYLTARNTMTQVLAVSGMQANLQIRAGETVTIAGRNRLNLSTRQPIITDTGANVLWSGTVTEAVTLDGAGAGSIIVTGPAIYEATGAYNTVDSAPVAGDVVTVLGAASTLYQPNLFWHPDAFSIGSVPMEKLYSTDTIATTEDGLQFRVSKGVGFLENQQKVRVDFRPAYGVMNPFFAGKGWGS